MLQRVGMAQALINDPNWCFWMSQCLVLIHWGATKCGDYSLASKNKARRFFSIATFSQRWSRFACVAILAQGELICSGCLDELLVYHVKG